MSELHQIYGLNDQGIDTNKDNDYDVNDLFTKLYSEMREMREGLDGRLAQIDGDFEAGLSQLEADLVKQIVDVSGTTGDYARDLNSAVKEGMVDKAGVTMGQLEEDREVYQYRSIASTLRDSYEAGLTEQTIQYQDENGYYDVELTFDDMRGEIRILKYNDAGRNNRVEENNVVIMPGDPIQEVELNGRGVSMDKLQALLGKPMQEVQRAIFAAQDAPGYQPKQEPSGFDSGPTTIRTQTTETRHISGDVRNLQTTTTIESIAENVPTEFAVTVPEYGGSISQRGLGDIVRRDVTLAVAKQIYQALNPGKDMPANLRGDLGGIMIEPSIPQFGITEYKATFSNETFRVNAIRSIHENN
ncbi:MAG: hypothetical protein ACD_50C00379G0003 [uncultured bacterium]|nr:MAG: hypothetical protein ACD_50C00379G0003 [uncultured bacterium]